MQVVGLSLLRVDRFAGSQVSWGLHNTSVRANKSQGAYFDLCIYIELLVQVGNCGCAPIKKLFVFVPIPNIPCVYNGPSFVMG